jgi:hypothetical protein
MTPEHAKQILGLIRAQCTCGRIATRARFSATGHDLFVRRCDAHSDATATDPNWKDLAHAEAIRALEREAGVR